MRHAMMIDLTQCVGCQACVSACKEQWDSGPGAARDWVRTLESGRRGADLAVSFYPGLCMQCEAHPCTTDCPTGATYMDANGVVVVDAQVCIGCGNCVSNCPYGARHVDPEKGIVEKCNLCAPFVARGEQPACVATCLTQCRHFGDLDDPNGPLARAIAEKGARPLVTPEVDVRPKVTFAGDAERARILASGAVKPPAPSLLTEVWTGLTLPFSRFGVPAIAVASVAGGALVNFLSRRRAAHEPQAAASAEPTATPAPAAEAVAAKAFAALPRHKVGMRVLHWFNLLSWALLLATGTALISAKSFAFFGTALPGWMAGLFGGAARLLKFHAVWGLLWAMVIVPGFLLYKRGGLEALAEIRLTRDDLRWLLVKPLAMLGLARQPLPPQDKYNAGQKIFALSALAGTATIIATGVVMTFHLGSAGTVAAAILLHKLAIALALVGLSVHVTMAVVIREERPALRSMVFGTVDRDHAARHNAKWVEELERDRKSPAATGEAHE